MRRRLVWLMGPMGVGKSTVGHRAQRASAGTSVFLDADQMGLCYPAPGDDLVGCTARKVEVLAASPAPAPAGTDVEIDTSTATVEDVARRLRRELPGVPS